MSDTQTQQQFRDERGINIIFIHSRLDDMGLTPYEFRIYARIARRAGKDGCYESIANMAEGCQMGHNTVRDALNGLFQRGMIARRDRPGKTSIFALTSPDHWRETPTGSGRGQEAPLPDQGGPPLPDQGDEGNPVEDNPEIQSSSPSRARENERDLSFIDPDNLNVYGSIIRERLEQYPTPSFEAYRRIWPKRYIGSVPGSWLREHTERHGWRRVVSALVLAVETAERPTLVYATRILNNWNDHGPTEKTKHARRRNPGRRVSRAAGASQSGRSFRNGNGEPSVWQKRDGELSPAEYLEKCGYDAGEIEALVGASSDGGPGRSGPEISLPGRD